VNKVKLISNSAFSKRRDEIFFRLTKGQLLQLYSEYEADEYEDIAETDRSFDGPRIVTYEETSRPTYDKPYLILDVRDELAYREYHLLQARNYSYTMMRRDQSHVEMMRFKNKEGHLIIVVADDERLGADAAKLLVDRGADNIFLLSASILEFAEENPTFVEGNPPISKSTERERLTTGRLTLLLLPPLIDHLLGSSTHSDSKSSRGSVTSRGSTSNSTQSNTLTSARLRMESSGPGASAGAKSGAAATALSAYRPPVSSSRDRSQLRTGSSDTMSTNSNMSSASGEKSFALLCLDLTPPSLSCGLCHLEVCGAKRKIMNKLSLIH
jgi:hypothetical protein